MHTQSVKRNETVERDRLDAAAIEFRVTGYYRAER